MPFPVRVLQQSCWGTPNKKFYQPFPRGPKQNWQQKVLPVGLLGCHKITILQTFLPMQRTDSPKILLPVQIKVTKSQPNGMTWHTVKIDSQEVWNLKFRNKQLKTCGPCRPNHVPKYAVEFKFEVPLLFNKMHSWFFTIKYQLLRQLIKDYILQSIVARIGAVPYLTIHLNVCQHYNKSVNSSF